MVDELHLDTEASRPQKFPYDDHGELGDLSLTHLAMFVCMGALGVAALAILAVAKGG